MQAAKSLVVVPLSLASGLDGRALIVKDGRPLGSESAKVNASQRKSTKVNNSQRHSTVVNASQKESTEVLSGAGRPSSARAERGYRAIEGWTWREGWKDDRVVRE